VVRIGRIRQGVDSGGIEEDHLPDMSASASSCLSDTRARRPCFERPAPTNVNWLTRVGLRADDSPGGRLARSEPRPG
jgi:hypothetical protein